MMGLHQHIGPAPMPAVARILSRFDRPTLEAFLSVAIDLIDTFDGDPDLEDDDPAEDADANEDDDPREEDDPSGQCDEDGINTGGGWQSNPSGPGCSISDGGR